MSDAKRALDVMVKAQNALALQAWDVVRVQESVKDADLHLAKCRLNLSEAHAQHTKLQKAVEEAVESWRLAVIAEHKPASAPAAPIEGAK